MALLITLTLPGLPVGKARARVTTRGTYTPAKTRNYEGMVRQLAAIEMAGEPPTLDPVELALTAWLPVPQSASKKRQTAMLAGELRPTGRPDLDNIAKAWSDGMNQIVYRDDAQIVRIVLEKRYGVTPKVVVTVRAA
jgi:Holliday junction resolvase RusA-like endonuclease